MSVAGALSRAMGLQPSSSAYKSLRKAYLEIATPKHRRSYSQFGEDLSLLRLLPERDGFFIDVGAGHPKRGSNTYALYRRGWSGVLIEPLELNVRKLRKHRSRDRIIRAACGRSCGETTLYEFDDYYFSTISATTVEELAYQGLRPISRHRVPLIALESLDIHAMPNQPSLLSVDVEGTELDVLEGNDWSRFLPRVVCIELWTNPLKSTSAAHEFLGDLGYVLNDYMGLSGIYLHQSGY